VAVSFIGGGNRRTRRKPPVLYETTESVKIIFNAVTMLNVFI
jgi:hypothetical protein